MMYSKFGFDRGIYRKGLKNSGILMALALGVMACNGDDARKIPNAPRYGLNVATTAIAATPAALALPAASNADWAAHLSNANHIQNHGVFDGTPNLVMRYNLGSMPRGAAIGASAPIVAAGRIFHYDAAGRLHAVGLDGNRQWVVDLTPADSSAGDGFGGGLAYEDGILYVATGYGDVVAVDAATGGEFWRYRHNKPLRSAPLVSNGRVVVVSGGSEAVALDGATGTVAWRNFGFGSTAPSRFNSGVPAASAGNAVLAYSSGVLVRNDLQSGQELWTLSAIGDDFFGQASVFGDVSGDPVIIGNQIIIGTRGGIQARDFGTGLLNWSSAMGSDGSVIAMGNSIFAISATHTLYRLATNNGTVEWSVSLPVEGGSGSFSGPRTNYLDPRIASGRLMTWDNKREMRQYDAATGGFLGVSQLPEQFAATPIIANGAIIGISDDGDLLVYR